MNVPLFVEPLSIERLLDYVWYFVITNKAALNFCVQKVLVFSGIKCPSIKYKEIEEFIAYDMKTKLSS